MKRLLIMLCGLVVMATMYSQEHEQFVLQQQSEEASKQKKKHYQEPDQYSLIKYVSLAPYFGPIWETTIPELIPHDFIKQLMDEAFKETSVCITMPNDVYSISPQGDYFLRRNPSTRTGGRWQKTQYTLYAIDNLKTTRLRQMTIDRQDNLHYVWRDNDILAYQDWPTEESPNEWVLFDLQNQQEISRKNNLLIYNPHRISPNGNYALMYIQHEANQMARQPGARKRALFQLKQSAEEINSIEPSLFTLPNTEFKLSNFFQLKDVFWSPNEHYFLIKDIANDEVVIYEIKTGDRIWHYECEHAHILLPRWSADSRYVVYWDPWDYYLVLVDVHEKKGKAIVLLNEDDCIETITWQGDFIQCNNQDTIKLFTKTGTLIAEKKNEGTLYCKHDGYVCLYSDKETKCIYERFDYDAFMQVYKLLMGKQPAYQHIFLQLLSLVKTIDLHDKSAFPFRLAWQRLSNNPIIKKILSKYVHWQEADAECSS